MGKKQTAQEKEDQKKLNASRPKNVLRIEYYVKKSGAIGMRKYYKLEIQK